MSAVFRSTNWQPSELFALNLARSCRKHAGLKKKHEIKSVDKMKLLFNITYTNVHKILLVLNASYS